MKNGVFECPGRYKGPNRAEIYGSKSGFLGILELIMRES